MRTISRDWIRAALVGGMLLGGGSAFAGPLTGQTIALDSSFAFSGSAVVGAGVEFQYAFGDIDFDFDENGLLKISYVRGSSTHSFGSATSITFSDVNGTIPKITGFTLVSVVGAVSGIEQSDLSFTEDSLRIGIGSQWGSLTATTGVPTATFQISFAQAAVPEPASLAVLGVGLAALASVRRRRKAA